MRILLLNQAFPPDVVSSAQHAADLVAALTDAGHEVTVITSSRAYDNPSQRFPRLSFQHGATIHRIPTTALGKARAWRRCIDFASFQVNCCLRLLIQPRYDVVIAMTSPPLISFVAALFTRLRGGRLLTWMMDLNPDEAIAGGWLNETGIPARVLEAALRFSLNTADSIVVLDKFMRDRVTSRGVPASKLTVIPPWSHDSSICYDMEGRDKFRRRHDLSGKFVVMYSGNLSPCHPLNTLLDAASQLRDEPDIAFCFVGGGSEFKRVQAFARERELKNIHCLPYQPLKDLSASLSSADLHVVVMGNPFVGIVHPCKIYNIMALGIPVLYIGPPKSHISDLGAEPWFFAGRHGQVSEIVSHILNARDAGALVYESQRVRAREFAQEPLIQRFSQIILGVVPDAVSTAAHASDSAL